MIERIGPHLAAAVAAFVHDEGVPGATAAVVAPDELPWSFAYGVADVTSGRSIGTDTALRVGSLTKPFTAAAILALRDDGRLGLDDPVVAHLPEFAAARIASPSSPVPRVRDLLTHRTGLPSEVPALDEEAGVYPSIEEILAGLADVELHAVPDEGIRYSNLGYQLLGEIVARRSGGIYEAFCERRLFAPLGLSRTGFDRPAGASRGHRARAFTDAVAVAADRPKRTNADGGLWSSADDLVEWIRAQLDGAPGLPDLPAANAEGIGWFREHRGTRTVAYHQGSTPGFAARLAFSVPHRAGAAILANGEAPTAGVLGTLLDLVLDAVDGAVPSGPVPPLPEPPARVAYPPAWDELVGFYVWPGSAMAYRLEVRAGALRLVDLRDDRHPVTLARAGEDRFVAVDGGWAGEPIGVRRAGDGSVRGLRVGGWSLARLVEAGGA